MCFICEYHISPLFFHNTKHVFRNFFALIWHSTVDEGYYLWNFWWYFFLWCTFYRCTAHQINILCSTEDISQVHRDHMRYMCNKIWLTPEVYTIARKLSALTQAYRQIPLLWMLISHFPMLWDTITSTSLSWISVEHTGQLLWFSDYQIHILVAALDSWNISRIGANIEKVLIEPLCQIRKYVTK